MSFDPKTAAEELLKLADLIEKEASEKTVFSCEGCNHTASLSSINAARSDFAKKQATELQVEIEARPVTVNDKIACPNCSSAMAYEPTAESERFYVESAEDSLADLDLDFGPEDKEDKPKKEKKEKKDEETAVEEPVAEEPSKEEAPKEEPPKEAPVEEPSKEEPPKEEPKKDDAPEEDIFEPVDEQAAKQEQEKAEEEDKKKKAPKKEKKEDKEDKPTPKFEKMPKEASERFIQKLAKYSL